MLCFGIVVAIDSQLHRVRSFVCKESTHCKDIMCDYYKVQLQDSGIGPESNEWKEIEDPTKIQKFGECVFQKGQNKVR